VCAKSEIKNTDVRWRCDFFIKDAYKICFDVCKSRGSGLFAVFDGHAGKEAAQKCSEILLETFESIFNQNPSKEIPNILEKTFLQIDQVFLNQPKFSSGCTAVLSFIRNEQRKLSLEGDLSECVL